MDIRERIKQYLDYKNITKYKFYKKTGFSNGFLDKKGAIGSDKCEKICSIYPDISADWLLLGSGKMLRTDTTTQTTTLPNENTLEDRIKKLEQKVEQIIEKGDREKKG